MKPKASFDNSDSILKIILYKDMTSEEVSHFLLELEHIIHILLVINKPFSILNFAEEKTFATFEAINNFSNGFKEIFNKVPPLRKFAVFRPQNDDQIDELPKDLLPIRVFLNLNDAMDWLKDE